MHSITNMLQKKITIECVVHAFFIIVTSYSIRSKINFDRDKLKALSSRSYHRTANSSKQKGEKNFKRIKYWNEIRGHTIMMDKNRSKHVLWLFVRHLEHKTPDPRLHWWINREDDDEETTKRIIIISFQQLQQQRRTTKTKNKRTRDGKNTLNKVKKI